MDNSPLASAHLISNSQEYYGKWWRSLSPWHSHQGQTSLPSHPMISGLLFFFCYCFPLIGLCTIHSLASNESRDCNIFSGAAQSSVKSSDCVTNFPVQGGIAVDCVPLLGMWFSGLIQYEQRELEGGSHVVELSLAQLRMWFVKGKIPDSRANGFHMTKTIICLNRLLRSNLSETSVLAFSVLP